jgi:hypothetical protein
MGRTLSAKQRQAVLDSITLDEFRELIQRFELMGRAEAAEALGVATTNLDQLGKVRGVRGLFMPEPVAEIKATRLWAGLEVREFGERVAEKRAQRKAA